jgi:hypothetical protein
MVRIAKAIRHSLRTLNSAARPDDSQTPAETLAASGCVSGSTMTSTCFQPDQKRRSVIQNSRSQEVKGGRGRFCLSTASCWRSATTSTAVAARYRKKTRMAAKVAKIRSSTNHRFNPLH